MIRAALLLCLAIALPAAAAPPCNTDGSQLEMNKCAEDDLARADSELNAVYRQAMSTRNDPLARERLRAAQRLWVQLRDADLAALFPLAEGDPRLVYGSIYPLEYMGAQKDMSLQRSRYLRERFLASDASTP